LFEFEGQWYLAYHSQVLEEAMGIESKGYRVTHVDAVKINDGKIEPVTGTRKGVEQVGRLDPFTPHKGAESGISAGLSFGSVRFADSPEPYEYAEISKNGSWLGVYGADFGSLGAENITVYVRAGQKSAKCGIEVRLGAASGESIGTLSMQLKPSGEDSAFTAYTAKLTKTINNVQDVFFVFGGVPSKDGAPSKEGGVVDFGGWKFSE
jgi:arabinoxylan arabinofuranohydrolase